MHDRHGHGPDPRPVHDYVRGLGLIVGLSWLDLENHPSRCQYGLCASESLQNRFDRGHVDEHVSRMSQYHYRYQSLLSQYRCRYQSLRHDASLCWCLFLGLHC